MSPSPRQELLSKIPGVDEVLSWPEVEDLIRKVPRRVVVDAIRDALERIRGRLLQQEGSLTVG